MRTSVFGDFIVENVNDDLGLVEPLQDAGDDIYAVIRKDVDEGTGKYDFEIMNNANGEPLVASDPIFDSIADAREFLRYFVHDIQEG